VNDQCKGKDEVLTTPVRGKVPNRAEYVVTDNTVTPIEPESNQRRLQRIIPHGPTACIDSGTCFSVCCSLFA